MVLSRLIGPRNLECPNRAFGYVEGSRHARASQREGVTGLLIDGNGGFAAQTAQSRTTRPFIDGDGGLRFANPPYTLSRLPEQSPS
jgi:hypothetical protein